MFHFGRPLRKSANSVLPADLPRPGVADAVRAFAYDAVRAATNALWLTVPGALDDGVESVLTAMPDLRGTGVRWSGAGVLPSDRAEWWTFRGDEAATLLFTGDALELERLALTCRRTLPAATGHATSATRGIARELLAQVEAAAALPVWDLAAFARLAPNPVHETGYITVAA